MAKAALRLWHLTVRLEAAPLQSYQSPLMRGNSAHHIMSLLGLVLGRCRSRGRFIHQALIPAPQHNRFMLFANCGLLFPDPGFNFGIAFLRDLKEL